MECQSDAPAGSVTNIQRSAFPSMVEAGDMIVCRTNAPLIGACLDLVKRGKRAYVKGIDLKINLLQLVDNITNLPDYRWKNFNSIMRRHKEAAIDSRLAEEDRQGATMIADRFDAIQVCIQNSTVNNEQSLKDSISDLFTEKSNSTVLSTVHRAKGLESDRVMVLHPHNLRLYWEGQLKWQAYQEQCCEYVAITRARKDLVFVEEPKKPYEIGKRLELPKEI